MPSDKSSQVWMEYANETSAPLKSYDPFTQGFDLGYYGTKPDYCCANDMSHFELTMLIEGLNCACGMIRAQLCAVMN